MTSSIDRAHTNRRMSKIVTHNDTVYLCGQVGNRGDSIEAQCAEAFRRIGALLAEAGTSKERMLQVIVWLKDMDDFDAMNAAYEAWVPEGVRLHGPMERWRWPRLNCWWNSLSPRLNNMLEKGGMRIARKIGGQGGSVRPVA